jgi:hypothetical protein
VVASSVAGARVTSAGFVSMKDPSVQAETSHGPGVGALDVMLSGCTDVVDCGNVSGLLAECLQDVSFSTLVLRIVASYCFVPNSQLFFRRLFL